MFDQNNYLTCELGADIVDGLHQVGGLDQVRVMLSHSLLVLW